VSVRSITRSYGTEEGRNLERSREILPLESRG